MHCPETEKHCAFCFSTCCLAEMAKKADEIRESQLVVATAYGRVCPDTGKMCHEHRCVAIGCSKKG